MIIFDLCCADDHRFEGWFGSPGEFEQQLADGMIHCPVCDSMNIRRVPSAVHLGTSASHDEPRVTPVQSAPTGHGQSKSPLAIYHQLVTELVSASVDVGDSFAEEARKIHYKESEPRSIHGQSTDQEFEALLDEGIEVWRLPVFRKDELN